MAGEIHPFTVTKFDAAPAGAEENSCNSCVLTPARSAPEDAEPSGNRIHESTMHAEEKHLIDGLFSRLREVEGHTAAREAQAEALINEHLARQPAAPYYMAQAIIVQENALQQLDGRVRELEAELEALKRAQQSAPPASSGGFLAGLFGGSRNPAPATTQPVSDTPSSQPARSGWQEPSAGRPSRLRPPGRRPAWVCPALRRRAAGWRLPRRRPADRRRRGRRHAAGQPADGHVPGRRGRAAGRTGSRPPPTNRR